MKKVIISVLVAVSLFGSTKSVEPNKNEIEFNKEYLCAFDGDTSGDKYQMFFVGYNLQFGSLLLEWTGGEYDIFKTHDNSGNLVTVSVLKSGKLRLIGKDVDIMASCKLK